MNATPVTREPPRFEMRRAGSVPALFLAAAVFGTLGSIAWLAAAMLSGDRHAVAHVAFAWLWGATVVHVLCVGSLFWVLLHHAVDAKWSVVVRRLFETLAAQYASVATALVILLVFFGQSHLYLWMRVDPAHDPGLARKAWYLSVPFFYARMALYLAVFYALARAMRAWSVAQDTDGDPRLTLRMRHWSYPGLFALAVCLTFAAFDWLMGLDYHWYSTMFGVYIFAGAALGSMALIVLASNALLAQGYLAGAMTEEHNHIMGKLLFAFTIFWAYITFSQYMLIYYANIPEETVFFRLRNTGNWSYFSWSLLFTNFAIPFLLLLTQPAKRNPGRLCFAAAWILFFQVTHLYWVIMPEFQGRLIGEGLLDPAGAGPRLGDALLEVLPLIAIAGVVGYGFLRGLERSAAVFPRRDPRLAESITLVN